MGGTAKMGQGAEVLGSMSYNGENVSTDPHKHTDAEGRPTSEVN